MHTCNHCDSAFTDPKTTGAYTDHKGALDHDGPMVSPCCDSEDITPEALCAECGDKPAQCDDICASCLAVEAKAGVRPLQTAEAFIWEFAHPDWHDLPEVQGLIGWARATLPSALEGAVARVVHASQRSQACKVVFLRDELIALANYLKREGSE